ncbi:MAG: single-stranded DNA-binding protein [Rhodoferax sp.]|nr:single-stranded DNA-binding protein [Rhodoferax sp.]
MKPGTRAPARFERIVKRTRKRVFPNEILVVASMRVMCGRYGEAANGGVQQIGGFWREVEIHGKKAGTCRNLLRKGARVLVIGEAYDFQAKSEDGQEVQVIKVVVEDVALQLSRIDSIVFMPSRPREGQQPE